jgi:hypothetical protein
MKYRDKKQAMERLQRNKINVSEKMIQTQKSKPVGIKLLIQTQKSKPVGIKLLGAIDYLVKVHKMIWVIY